MLRTGRKELHKTLTGKPTLEMEVLEQFYPSGFSYDYAMKWSMAQEEMVQSKEGMDSQS